jgi:hypothetical protein
VIYISQLIWFCLSYIYIYKKKEENVNGMVMRSNSSSGTCYVEPFGISSFG